MNLPLFCIPFHVLQLQTVQSDQRRNKKVGFSGKGIRAGFSEDDIEEQNIREAETPRVLGSACHCLQFLGLKCNLLLFEETGASSIQRLNLLHFFFFRHVEIKYYMHSFFLYTLNLKHEKKKKKRGTNCNFIN